MEQRDVGFGRLFEAGDIDGRARVRLIVGEVDLEDVGVTSGAEKGPSTQCAAVSTHSGAMAVPVHVCGVPCGVS